jgi:DNA-binding MurR/RpiR family transcriptional regulator
MFENARFINTASTSEMFEQIMRIEKGDVMIGISFPRYSKQTAKALSFAAGNGAKVVAITDSQNSPIAEYSTHTLIAKSDMASFVDSLVAPLSIINAILVAVVMKKQEETDIRLRQLEKIWKEYDVYATGDGGNANG